jgi:hypothetical protein
MTGEPETRELAVTMYIKYINIAYTEAEEE